MKTINNIIYPDNGKVLKTSYGIKSQVTLGTFEATKNGKIVTVEYKLDDIKEVTPINIFDKIYYIESTDYGNIVTELIRLKYSLDDELALYANSRLDPNSEEEQEFLNWRKVCKQVAKKLINE